MTNHDTLLKLKRFNTPTISNALEHLTNRKLTDGINIDAPVDYMPEMGPMIGYAITMECSFLERSTPNLHQENFNKMMSYLEKQTLPQMIVMKDIHSPHQMMGSAWGECAANMYKSMGAVGAIVDGAIRDLDEMVNAGFHTMARRLCVSHAYVQILSVGQAVEVYGLKVKTGDLIHADKHGFITIPEDAIEQVYDMALYLDALEMKHIIAPARQKGYNLQVQQNGFENYNKDLNNFMKINQNKGEWQN